MSSPPVHHSFLGHADSAVDIESDVEDEIDQLDSDTDIEEADGDLASPSTSKGISGKAGVRMPGQSLLPAIRLENIIQADGKSFLPGVTGNLALSKEGLFVLSIATEEFIKRLAERGHVKANSEQRSIVSYKDMAAVVRRCEELQFLRDTIPCPIYLENALALREELLEEDATIPPPVSEPPPPFRVPSVETNSTSAPPPEKGKGRAVNGKEKLNGSGSSASSSRRESARAENGGHRTRGGSTRDIPVTNGEWSELTEERGAHRRRSSRNGAAPSVPVTASPPIINGHSSTISRSGSVSPPPLREAGMDPLPPSRQTYRSRTPPYHRDEPPWPGQFTGPASGFLQGPGAPFGRPSQNAGRTIYSQSQRTD